MAVDMFIKIDSVKGESQDKTHKDADRRVGLVLGHVAYPAPRTWAGAPGRAR